MKNRTRKIETFTYRGLGFPIKLVDVPMKRVIGEWVIDIDMNQLQEDVFLTLIDKSSHLTDDELDFMRLYLNMTRDEFGKALEGCSRRAKGGGGGCRG